MKNVLANMATCKWLLNSYICSVFSSLQTAVLYTSISLHSSIYFIELAVS